MDSQDDHSNQTYPSKGARRIRGAAFDVSEDNQLAILNFGKPGNHVYSCFAEETCPTTGRKHLQFYIVLKNYARVSTLRSAIKDASFRACHKDHAYNINYVLKQRDEDYDAHAEEDNYQGNIEVFQESGERPDIRKIAARTLESLHECQQFYECTAMNMPPELRMEALAKLCDVTDSLCHLMDHANMSSGDEHEDEDIDMCDRPPVLKRMKIES